MTLYTFQASSYNKEQSVLPIFAMVQADPNRATLPSSAELPCSDETPVDNENQNYIPNLLLFLLEFIWGDRLDWFFGVDMGIYHTTGENLRIPVIPDGFLSLDVRRVKPELPTTGRLSYVLWEENDIPPILTLEIVSQTYGGEYDDKMQIYAKLGVLYYVIYNPNYWRRNKHQPLEVYRLVDGVYQLQTGEPVWMPEIGLGIGRFQHSAGAVSWEALTWYDAAGTRYLSRAEVERQRAEQERQRAEQERQIRLQAVSKLLEMGLSAEQVAEALSLSIGEVRSIQHQ